MPAKSKTSTQKSQRNGYELIDLGTMESFKKKIQALDERFDDRDYRLSRLDSFATGDFWVFEEEVGEDTYGAILQVEKSRVYAISKDVYDFVQTAFARK